MMNRIVFTTASVMVHTELHSIQPQDGSSPSQVSFVQMRPLPPPFSGESVQLLAHEMENMIIEGNIRKGAGPLRSASEDAIASGRAAQRFGVDVHNTSTFRSPGSHLVEPMTSEPEALAEKYGSLESEQKHPLPSAGPPGPELSRRGSNIVRNRSVSC
jgi:hypothetical protein